MSKKVIVGCEFSQVVTKAFRAAGYKAYSCDILPCEGGHPKWHIQDDILNHLDKGWDLGIFHPSCQFITNAGVRHLHENVTSKNGVRAKIYGKARFKEMEKACEFFNKLRNAPIPRICVENPIPHKYAKALIGKYDQLIQPYQFGHGETKATCLWLKNLPKLVPTNIVTGREHRIHMMGPSKDRSKLRSIFFSGFGEAMASQWGPLL